MQGRPSPAADRTTGTGPARPPRWPFAILACAGLIGASGVGIGAAGAHAAGGDLTRIASDFLLIHAATLAAGSGLALGPARGSRIIAAGLILIAVGAVLFGGELALAGLAAWRPVPQAAPVGGLCLIAGWLMLAGTGLDLGLRRR